MGIFFLEGEFIATGRVLLFLLFINKGFISSVY